MPNKDYSDEFFKEYTPKNFEEYDTDRDLHSFSKTETQNESPKSTVTTKREAPHRSPAKPKSAQYQKSTGYFYTGKKVAKGVINKYGEICMINLGTIIKVIAFVVAFAIIIGSLVLGLMLFASRSGLSAISLLVIIAGAVVAAILFFPIYGIGHIIAQNNEILRIFTDQTDK